MRLVLTIGVCLVAVSNWSIGQDIVFLKSGESAACDIEAITDNIITFTLRQQAGTQGGIARRTVDMAKVDYIEFDFEPGEESEFLDRNELDVAQVERWWNHHFAHLHRPRSRTAAWGNALGEALLRNGSDVSKQRALQLYERIAEKAWDERDVADAKRGKLQALIALDDLEEATHEAHLLASETEDPELLIEVKYLLAKADFARLRDLEEEHPRWEEDDEVKPERNALYHSTIDQFMWPYLFYAAREGAAARGLLSAGDVYRFGGEFERARGAFTDLTRLYEESPFAEAAVERLEELTEQEQLNSTELTEDNTP